MIWDYVSNRKSNCVMTPGFTDNLLHMVDKTKTADLM